MEATEDELIDLMSKSLTDDEFYDLVHFPDTDNMTRDELVLNFKKLAKYAEYRQSYEKHLNYKLSSKIDEVKRLKEQIKEIETDTKKEETEYSEPFFADYLRKGYKVINTVGSISIVDKEGNRKGIANTDGDWHETIIHEIIQEEPMLTVLVTEEQEDGSYVEVDRYKITP